MNYYLRDITINDLPAYGSLIQPEKLYHKFNGPYYEAMTSAEIEQYLIDIESRITDNKIAIESIKMIVDSDTEALIGQVNWYWKSKETNWMEVGIVIFNEDYWGKGIGKEILPLWIDNIFEDFPELVRIGLSTWSGNTRMMKLAERIGLKKEAQYLKARIVDGQYYDSLSYGILKEEWLRLNSNS